MDLFFSIADIADQVVILILVFCSILVIGVSFERYFFIRKVYRSSLRVRHKLRLIMASSQDISVIKEITLYKDSLEGKVMKYALKHIEKYGSKGLVEVFNANYLQEKPLLEGAISILATIGGTAPFIGLLGTVFGIIRSFNDLGVADGGGAGQQVVMTGISVALLATGIGLVVAIPAVILYNYFRKRVDSILDTLENVKEACVAYSHSKQ